MNIIRAIVAAAALLMPAAAFAQSTVLQGGVWTGGRVPMYSSPASTQPVAVDSGPAGGGGAGVGISELGITKRGTGTAPYANGGTGELATSFCMRDAPITNAGGYHYLCLDPNAQGGGLLTYGAAGGASTLGFTFTINGVSGCTGSPTAVIGGLATTCTSDERLKNIDAPYTAGLEALRGVQPIRFHWKGAFSEDTATEQVGFSAQNVVASVPAAAWLAKQSDGKEWYTVSDRVMVATLVNAVKELEARLAEAERKLRERRRPIK